jgi:carbamoyl-phosphate synthase large subunit
MNVFITSVGSNTSIAVVKALKRQSEVKVIIIGGDLNERQFCAGAAHVDFFIKTPSVFRKEKYEEVLINIVEKYSIQCVIAVHDYEIALIAELKVKYPKLTFWAVNDPAVIDSCNDKLKANNIVNSLGIKVPAFGALLDFEVDNTWDKPFIVKPINGVSSSGIYSVLNSDDLNYVKARVDLSNCMIQEFVKGTEYTVDCYNRYNSEFYGGIVRERIETKSGISVKGKIIDNEELLEASSKILNTIGYKGASNIQFICNETGNYFIELNPRFSGAGILSYVGGLNSPLFTILEAAGLRLSLLERKKVNIGLTMTRFWDEIFYDAKGNII